MQWMTPIISTSNRSCHSSSKSSNVQPMKISGLQSPPLSPYKRHLHQSPIKPLPSLFFCSLKIAFGGQPRKLSLMNLAIGPRSAAVPHGLDLPTRSQFSWAQPPYTLAVLTKTLLSNNTYQATAYGRPSVVITRAWPVRVGRPPC